MSYIIIGGDGKEYGPIAGSNLRQWVIEGRLNAQSLAKAVSDAEFRPLEKFPEFADLWGGGAGPQPATIQPLSAGVIEDDYEIDIGGCLSRAWQLYKDNFGLLFVCVLILMVVLIIGKGIINAFLSPIIMESHASPVVTTSLGFIYPVLSALYLGPLGGGLMIVYFRKIRGEQASVDGIFSGFQKAFAPLFIGQLILGLIYAICLLPFTVVFNAKSAPILEKIQTLQAGGSHDPSELLGQLSQLYACYLSALPILLIVIIPYTYLYVSFQFTVPLIADKQMGVGEALKTSWKRVNKHWWQVFGLVFLAGLIAAAGLLGCCIGILFTLPLTFAMTLYGYEIIFNGRKY